MSTPAFKSSSFLIAATVSLFVAGCSGSTTPNAPQSSAPGFGPQPHVAGTDVGTPSKSRGSALLYVSSKDQNKVLIYSYPGLRLRSKLLIPNSPWGLCSDPGGDVFVTARARGSSQSYVYKYPRGESQPSSTLSDAGAAVGCSYDAVSGNLAVTNATTPGSPYQGDVAVFPDASGTPTTYSDPNVNNFFFCSYDDSGNLFATSVGNTFIDELPAGSESLSEISLDKSIFPGSIQWYDHELVVTYLTNTRRGPLPVYRVRVVGGKGRVGKPILLYSPGDHNVGNTQYLTDGNTIIGPGIYRQLTQLVRLWPFPKGGSPKETLRLREQLELFGVTISE